MQNSYDCLLFLELSFKKNIMVACGDSYVVDCHHPLLFKHATSNYVVRYLFVASLQIQQLSHLCILLSCHD